MANEFVGIEEPVAGLGNAAWGSVAVVLRNGLPQRLITPGSRFARGWRAPFTGNLTFVQVNTDSVPFGLPVPQVPTRDGYHVGIDLDVRVKLNPADDYRHLSGFITRSGRGFAEDLVVEVQRGLEQLVYRVLAERDHASLRQASLSTTFSSLGLPLALGTGLLLVTSLNVSKVTWDPKAIELENVDKDWKVQSAAQAVEAELGAERLQVFAGVAAQLGLPAEALAFPERYALGQQRAHEALLALLKPEMRMVWQRNPALLTNLFELAGIGNPQPPGSAPALAATRLQAVGQLGGEHVGGGTTWDQLPAAHEELTEVIIEPDEVELNRSLALQRAWSSHATEPVRGIVAAGRGGPVPTVVVVTDSGAPPSAATVEALTRAVGGHPRVVVLRTAPLPVLVAQWFHQVCPAGSGLGLATTMLPDDRMLVRIQGPLDQARAAVRALTAPDDTAVAALEELTGLVRVDVELGEG